MNTKTKKTLTGQDLTPKQAAFVKHIIDNPKDNATKAAQVAYGKPGELLKAEVAGTIANQNLNKPAVISALQEHMELVESTLVNTIREWGAHERPRQREIAQTAAMYVHDKVLGKSRQQIDIKTEAVIISIDLTKPSEEE